MILNLSDFFSSEFSRLQESLKEISARRTTDPFRNYSATLQRVTSKQKRHFSKNVGRDFRTCNKNRIRMYDQMANN